MVHRDLPMDIIGSEILTRLPAKSVGRFMCVSKQWLSFLSSLDFRRKHLHHLTTFDTRSHQKLLLLDPPLGSFSTLDCGTTPTDLSTHRPTPFGSNYQDHDMHVVASLDGLVCVFMSKTKQFVLWNPLTGAYRMFSISNLHLHTFKHVVSDAFGLYYDSCNDYKLLHLVRDKKGPRVYIYSRRLDSWFEKFLSFNCVGYLGRCWAYQWSPSTFLSQTLYFTVVTCTLTSTEHYCIAAFDVESESFREIQFPSQVPDFRAHSATLVVMNGCVHLCVPNRSNDTEFYMPSVDIDVWRMVGDGDGWIKLAAYSCNNSIPFSLTPVCIVRHGKWVVTWRYNKAYNKDCVTSTWSSYPLARAIYIETLVSPNP